MKRMIELNIPSGIERDTFIRRLAETKSPEERQELVEKVQEFLALGEPTAQAEQKEQER